ncbi:hypothetical protein LSM04_009632 [Trypanosoma melophagium]|uniref:uncharacterized protein n=1 Tax=Trypanosoma melophagium TaxID=715481 RepID=UPI00351A983E|nr:hypothetical protein LSM04_009632 [Trypanosoma melophagium]
MSESGSIRFFEQSDHGSAKSSVPPSCDSHKQAVKSIKQVLDRPPLHQTARRDLRQQLTSSPKRRQSSTSSHFGAADHEDVASEYSESNQFHTEAASRNLSFASIPAIPPVRNPPLNTGQDEPKLDSRLSSRRQSDCAKIEGADESIHFHIEGANSSQEQDAQEQVDVSRNDSILFQVVDDPLSEDLANKVPAKENNAIGTAKGTVAHPGDSTDSTIVLKTSEEGGAKAEDAKAVSGAANLDYVLQTTTKAAVADPLLSPSSSSAAAVSASKSTSINEKTEKKPTLRRKTLPPGETQGVSSTEERNDVVATVGMPLIIGPSKAKKIPSNNTCSVTQRNETMPNASLSLKGKVKSNSVKILGKSEETLQLNTHGETKTQFHLTVPPSVSSDGVKLPVRSASSGNLKEQERLQLERNDDMESSLHSNEPSPSATGVVPMPYPSTMDAASVSSLFTLEEGILQAKMYTEHWKMFNDIQREEIASLVRRIMEARKADTLPDVLEAINRRQTTEAATLSGFDDIFNKKGNLRGKNRMSSTRNVTPNRSCSGIYPHKMRSTPFLRVSSLHSPSSPSHTTREIDKHSVSLKNDVQTFTRKTVGEGVLSFGDNSSEWHTAAAKVAQSLSIVWPPKSKDTLFFITGSRLTKQQCGEFHEAVKLQASASERVRAEVQRATKEGDATEKRKQKSMKKKPVATRTTILRKAFKLIDIDQKGVILATDIPAMRQLLEAERQHIDEIANGGASSKTILKRARDEQKILKGNIDVRRPSLTIKQDAASLSLSSITAASESLLYAFVLDVILPLLSASDFLEFDFTTLGLLVFGSVGLSGINTNPDFIKWRQAALHFFEVLA